MAPAPTTVGAPAPAGEAAVMQAVEAPAPADLAHRIAPNVNKWERAIEKANDARRKSADLAHRVAPNLGTWERRAHQHAVEQQSARPLSVWRQKSRIAPSPDAPDQGGAASRSAISVDQALEGLGTSCEGALPAFDEASARDDRTLSAVEAANGAGRKSADMAHRVAPNLSTWERRAHEHAVGHKSAPNLSTWERRAHEHAVERKSAAKLNTWERRAHESKGARRLVIGGVNIGDVNSSASESREKMYSAAELKDAGFSARQQYEAGCSIHDLRSAGYRVQDLYDLGISAAEALAEGITVNALKHGGYSAIDLKAAGVMLAALRAAGFAVKDLLQAGFTVHELRVGGCHANELLKAGVPEADLLEAGFTHDQIVQQTEIIRGQSGKMLLTGPGSMYKLHITSAAQRPKSAGSHAPSDPSASASVEAHGWHRKRSTS